MFVCHSIIKSFLARLFEKLNPPEILIISNDSVNIKWNSLSENLNYIIKYKSENNSIWNELIVNSAPATIDNLKEGVYYVFKIAPQTFDGFVGDYSDETIPIKVASKKFYLICVLF